MHLRVLFATVLTLAAIGPAQGGDTAQATREAMLRDDYSCTASEAPDVDIHALQADPERYVDRCLRVVGYADGHRLIGSMHDVDANLEELEKRRSHFLGIQLREAAWRHILPWENFPWDKRTEFIGRFRSCEKRSAIFKAATDEAGAELPPLEKMSFFKPDWPVGSCQYQRYVLFSTQWRILL